MKPNSHNEKKQSKTHFIIIVGMIRKRGGDHAKFTNSKMTRQLEEMFGFKAILSMFYLGIGSEAGEDFRMGNPSLLYFNHTWLTH